MSDISSTLYWSMPGPREFSDKVTEASRNARALVLSFPEYMPVQPMRAVGRALKNANIYEPVTLNIQDGMNISVEIGTHFGVTNMPAQSLVHHVHGAQHAVVLHANGKRAQEHCEKYASEFVNALEDAVGDVRLVVAIRSGEHKKDASLDKVRVIAFDGALKAAEMTAYVAQRMVSYDGPGSASLFRHLVTEYAGFDPSLAEQLSQMDPRQILALPDSLSLILSDNLLRWSQCSWVAGTTSSSSKELHALHEWYVATHSGPDAEKFRHLSERRYWRACLKAIIPWLEERRPQVIAILNRPISQVENASGGPGKIAKLVGKNYVYISRDELEYNDISFQSSTPDFNRIALSQDESRAVSICSLAKRVRDDLSHLRRPNVEEVAGLISSMDAMFPD